MSNTSLIIAGIDLAGLKPTYYEDTQCIGLWNTNAVLIAEIPQFGEDFDTDGQGANQAAVAQKLIEVLDIHAAEEARRAEPGGDFCVIQEGGSSTELYLHVSSFREDAEEFRIDCATDGAYRTSGVIEAPAVLKRLSPADREAVFAWADELIKATNDLDLAKSV